MPWPDQILMMPDDLCVDEDVGVACVATHRQNTIDRVSLAPQKLRATREIIAGDPFDMELIEGLIEDPRRIIARRLRHVLVLNGQKDVDSINEFRCVSLVDRRNPHGPVPPKLV